MENKKYLSEEKYQKNKTLLIVIAAIVLIIGVSIGGILLANGIQRVTNNYKQDELAGEKAKLLAEKARLEAQGIKYDKFAQYTDGKKYDLKVITDALDPSFDYCSFDECENHELTAKYCKLKNGNGMSPEGATSLIFGAFIILASLMISLTIFANAKGREIAAFHAQQIMPVAQEGIEEMTPTMSKASGMMAKEIAKGIKEGLNEDSNK